MMLPNYARAYIIEVEGGYSDHKHDKGGVTKYGISAAFLRKVHPELRDEEIALMVDRLTVEQAARIYCKEFWNAGSCDLLYDRHLQALALVHFDGLVQHGQVRASKLLQETLAVEADGIIGRKTRAAMEQIKLDDELGMCCDLIERRTEHYRTLKDFRVFGNGWLNRMDTLRREVNALL